MTKRRRRARIPGKTELVPPSQMRAAFMAAAEHGIVKARERLFRNIAKGLDDRTAGGVFIGLTETELVALAEVLASTALPPLLEELRDELAKDVSGTALHLRIVGEG